MLRRDVGAYESFEGILQLLLVFIEKELLSFQELRSCAKAYGRLCPHCALQIWQL